MGQRSERSPKRTDPAKAPVTYQSYLRIPELLTLQRPGTGGDSRAELLFIVAHQVYELWFLLILGELDYVRDKWIRGKRAETGAALKRILAILKHAVAQMDLLETMTPLSFGEFRGRLGGASGFQSAQFRELEAVLGTRRQSLGGVHMESAEKKRLARRLQEPSIWDAFLALLAGSGWRPEAFRDSDASGEEAAGSDRSEGLSPVERMCLAAYRKDPAMREFCERMIDLDEGVQEWRYRHIKLVERMIGSKRGTGGTLGARYLAQTLQSPAFPVLWAIRSAL